MKKFLIYALILGGAASVSTAQTPLNALEFDGSNDYVSAPLPTLFNDLATNDFTVETWLKPTGLGTQRVFFAQSTSTTFCSILLNASNVPYVFIMRNSLSSSINALTPLPLNQWSHLACTWDASTGNIEVYINGMQTSGVNGGSSSVGSDNVMTIGSRTDGAQVFNGELDEMRIWNNVRTICEIGGSMHSEFSTTQPNLIAYYNFNQGAAGGSNTAVTTLPDFTSSFNGTLNNFALSGTSSNWVASGAEINLLNENQGIIYGSDVQTSCSSFTWIDGITYNSSNNSATFSYSGGSVNGCDSVVILDLTVNSPSSGTDVITACNSYTWIDGITYNSSNNSATFTLQNSVGCDSVVTLDLTINSPSSGTDVISACNSYTWIDGITYNSSNNSATFTMQNSVGCDSVVTLDLTINTVTATISDNSPTLIASPSGAIYQWIDCDNGNAPIVGETSDTFTASVNGNYAVILIENGCSDTSACVNVANVGLSESTMEQEARIYPNPNNGTFTVELIKSSDYQVEIKLMDALGREIYRLESGETTLNFELSLEAGTYYVLINNRPSVFVVK